jgi:hypothetical protein
MSTSDSAVTQLRSHIPIAGPARREAADGNEPHMRPVVGFEPGWYHSRCGVALGERWHCDPDYRRETLIRMRAHLRGSFPMAGQWDHEEEADVCTISGCFGVYVIPCAFGVEVQYFPDRWPTASSGPHLSDHDVERLTPERALASRFVEDLFDQMELIASKWGAVHGDLNWQGVLNNAFHLRGQQIFLDMVDRPDLANHLFSVIAEVMIRLGRAVQERQRRSGFDIDYMCVSNCTVNMISPAMYATQLLPLDARIADCFEGFGVHTCNWDISPYLDVLRRLPKVGYLDMGSQSDLRRVRALFPNTRRAVLLTPAKVHTAPLSELRRKLERICADLAPCDVVVGDIPAGTPDAKVNFVLDTCRELTFTATHNTVQSSPAAGD